MEGREDLGPARLARTTDERNRHVPHARWGAAWMHTDNMDLAVKSGIAGGLAGCAAKTLVAPLDRVKILFQSANPQFVKYSGTWLGFLRALNTIYSDKGVRGLLQGHSATLLRIFPYAAIKFVAYEEVRALLIPSKEYETWQRRFAAGSLAGMASVFVVYPLDVVRVRLAYETGARQASLVSVVKNISQEQSSPGGGVFARVRNFYRGFTPTLLGMFCYAGSAFLVHDAIGDIFRSDMFHGRFLLDSAREPTSSSRHTLPPLRADAEVVTGGISGLISQTASYPFEVVRRKMQVGGKTAEHARLLGLRETVRLVYTTSGFKGFFVGLSVGYLKIVPMSATSFLVYTRLKVWLGI